MLLRRTSVLRVRDGDCQEESRACAPNTHSLGQTFVFIKGRAACDPLFPDVLSSLVDLAEVTVTAILEHLITLKPKKANLKVVFGYKVTSNHDLEPMKFFKQIGRLSNKNETVSIKSPHPEYTQKR